MGEVKFEDDKLSVRETAYPTPKRIVAAEMNNTAGKILSNTKSNHCDYSPPYGRGFTRLLLR